MKTKMFMSMMGLLGVLSYGLVVSRILQPQDAPREPASESNPYAGLSFKVDRASETPAADRFRYLAGRYAKALNRLRSMDPRFYALLDASCSKGRGLTLAQYRSMEKYLGKLDTYGDSGLGGWSERDLIAFVATAVSEARGLGTPHSSDIDDVIGRAEYVGVMKAVANRVPGYFAGTAVNVLGIVMDHDGVAYNGWLPSADKIACHIIGRLPGEDGYVFGRAVRAFQDFTDPKTRYEGDFDTSVKYFAGRESYNSFRATYREVLNPYVVLPGEKRIHLYREAGDDPLRYFKPKN
ncbi:MAG: hypothetical protein JST16_15480 [Bdellovibrionales bacterium]|nr:hypothetical protein [Bdellovibrionales bacterium]